MSHPIEVLLVEDDERSRRTVRRYLEDNSFLVTTAGDAETAGDLLQTRPFSVVIVDYKLPGKDGIAFIREVKERRAAIPCILITAHGDVQSAVQAMKAGAFQFLEKPIEPQELVELIRQACEKEQLALELDRLRRELDERYGFENIIGSSVAMTRVFDTVKLAAPTNSTVLLTGESGTGKELVARAVHHNSPRRDQPFVPVNCAALPAELVESELFGHERGAFTGAVAEKQGYFEAAGGGTLFIDEVSEMPLGLQAKLLRALEQKVINRVGSTKEVRVDVRIIAASNQNLEQLVSDGRFREDLFYRLCVVRIHLPPLRERREDIPLLVSAFVKELNTEHGRQIRTVSPDALNAFQQYAWPGNVRELRNVLESAVVLSTRQQIELDDLPAQLRDVSSGAEVTASGPGGATPSASTAVSLAGQSLAEIEKRAILATLEHCGGNRTKAAETLGIAVRTVQRKLAEYGVQD